MGVRIEDVDESKLEALQGKVIGDVAGSMGLLMAYMGDQLDLYSALAEICPATSQELADNMGMKERYVREWLSANAAGGYIEYDPASQKFSMTPEQAVIFAAEGNPHCMQGFFQAVVSGYTDEPKATEAFRTGEGVPWGDHSTCLFCGTERFFRPMYAANLVESWIPALDGVKEKLRSAEQARTMVTPRDSLPSTKGFGCLRLIGVSGNDGLEETLHTMWVSLGRENNHLLRSHGKLLRNAIILNVPAGCVR